jgi:hypothetical protein
MSVRLPNADTAIQASLIAASSFFSFYHAKKPPILNFLKMNGFKPFTLI